MTTTTAAGEARLRRYKDQSIRLRGQQRDNAIAAGKTMKTLLDQGVTKSRLAELWRSSRGQVDEMIARSEES